MYERLSLPLLENEKGSLEQDWMQILQDGRKTYDDQRENLLKYIKHPEALAELSVDPLADEPNSPWDTARRDEAIRQEIQQDVQRLPDEANYHDGRIQVMILDVLFVYCKNNPARGGYRQGMHELLAPIVHVLEEDALERAAVADSQSLDDMMVDLLDSSFVEHDAYILFSRLMDNAQSFYAVNETSGKPNLATPGNRGQSSTIVERSKFIHESCLNKVDPELALHLTNIEILPQIFLIREFPFEQSLVLWDTIFAVDPNLELIDLICVAMLIRIRWQCEHSQPRDNIETCQLLTSTVLGADYSTCLQLLLKYPPPSQPHGPHTFVDDAVYLRSHLNASGGATLIMKYTGKLPTMSKEGSRPSTPSFRGFNALRQKNFGSKSPLNSPRRFGNQQVGVEALFQGAAKGAKGVFERGEKLGINQAVRDAMGEIRRNMQAFNEARQTPQSQDNLSDDAVAATAFAAMQERNHQLAAMLEETVANLKDLSASKLEDKSRSLDAIEVAAAKIQFVKIYLEDSTMELPEMDVIADEGRMDTDDTAENFPASKSPEPKADIVIPNVKSLTLSESGTTASPPPQVSAAISPTSQQTMDTSGGDGVVPADPLNAASAPPLAVRPAAIPTRSTLAQSSFSWMLEPNEPASTPKTAPNSRSPPPGGHKKRPSNNASREKNAFLFGEVTSEADGRDTLDSNDIFGLQPLRKESNT